LKYFIRCYAMRQQMQRYLVFDSRLDIFLGMKYRLDNEFIECILSHFSKNMTKIFILSFLYSKSCKRILLFYLRTPYFLEILTHCNIKICWERMLR